MGIKSVAGKSVKAFIALLLSTCFSSERIAFAIAPLLPVVPPVSAQAAWQKLITNEDNFSVMMPVLPETRAQGEFTLGSNGELINKARIASAYHNGVVYLVRIYDTSNPKRLLSKYPSIIGLADAEERNSNVGGIEGKQYVKKREGYAHFIHLFPTKKRLYVLEAAARDENNASIRRFVSSLTLGDAAPAATTDNKLEPATGQSNGSVTALPVASDLAPLTLNEVTRPAILIYKPQPPYPARAKQLGVSGKIKFSVVLSASGEVTNIKVTQGLGGGLSEAVTQTVKSIKFLPAEKDGRLVSQYAEVFYNFELRWG